MKKNLRGEVLWSALLPSGPLGGNLLADTVVGKLEVHSGVRVPLLPGVRVAPHEDIRWFEVAVDDVLGVEVVQCLSHLWHGGRGRGRWGGRGAVVTGQK